MGMRAGWRGFRTQLRPPGRPVSGGPSGRGRPSGSQQGAAVQTPRLMPAQCVEVLVKQVQAGRGCGRCKQGDIPTLIAQSSHVPGMRTRGPAQCPGCRSGLKPHVRETSLKRSTPGGWLLQVRLRGRGWWQPLHSSQEAAPPAHVSWHERPGCQGQAFLDNSSIVPVLISSIFSPLGLETPSSWWTGFLPSPWGSQVTPPEGTWTSCSRPAAPPTSHRPCSLEWTAPAHPSHTCSAGAHSGCSFYLFYS